MRWWLICNGADRRRRRAADRGSAFRSHHAPRRSLSCQRRGVADRPRAQPRVAAEGVSPLGSCWSTRQKLEQVESILPPLLALDEVGHAILAGREQADLAARTLGARVAALATSVALDPPTSPRTPGTKRSASLFGLTMKEQRTCGDAHPCHGARQGRGHGRPDPPVAARAARTQCDYPCGRASIPATPATDTRRGCAGRAAGSYDRFGSAQEYRQWCVRSWRAG